VSRHGGVQGGIMGSIAQDGYWSPHLTVVLGVLVVASAIVARLILGSTHVR
jgi:hypothetical protein